MVNNDIPPSIKLLKEKLWLKRRSAPARVPKYAYICKHASNIFQNAESYMYASRACVKTHVKISVSAPDMSRCV